MVQRVFTTTTGGNRDACVHPEEVYWTTAPIVVLAKTARLASLLNKDIGAVTFQEAFVHSTGRVEDS